MDIKTKWIDVHFYFKIFSILEHKLKGCMDLFCNNNCKNRVVSNLDLISKSYFKYMKQTLNLANISL